ncbi:unnamed protein product [Arctogadus glacialis]
MISMYRRLNVLILTCIHLFPDVQVSGPTDPIFKLENVSGKLVFYQNEGNSTLVRDTGELASSVQTVAMFQIFDPEQTLVQTKLTYTWDFGNGEVIEGTEPVARYNYTESGNYTLRLQVGANMTKQEVPIAGDYSMDLKVIDAISKIEMEGHSSYHVAENVSMFFHVDGSPPMWVCWQVVPDCRSMTPSVCTRSVLYSHMLRLNHTFASSGLHCLDISVQNDISSLHSSFSVYVGRGRNTNLFFIMSCLAVLAATFSFIGIIACRPRHPNLLQVGRSSSALFLNDEDGSQVKLSFSGLERGESQPLILRHGLMVCS